MDYGNLKSITPVLKNYASAASLPLSGNDVGAQALVQDTNRLYIWNGSGWYNIALINQTPNIVVGADSAYSLDTAGANTVIQLVAEDPEGLPITWSYAVTEGALNNTATVTQSANTFTVTPSTLETDANTFSLTFTVSDGVNIATSLAEFTLQFFIEDSKYTTLMLKTNETDGSQNNTFLDGSTNNFTITRNGNATQGSFGPYGDRWSNYFDEDLITTPSDTSLSLQSDDFTFECWYYPTDRIDAFPRIFQFGSAFWASSDNLAILDRHNDASTKFGVAIYNLGGNSILLQSTTVVQENVWYHISLTREGSTFRLFINGVLESTYTNSGAVSTSSSNLGRIGGTGAADAYSVGYISDLRIIKGIALYTSDFTPPAEPLTAVPNTVLLTCQSNRFADNSPNDLTLTPTGEVKVTKFSPFDQKAYSSATDGGSGYFEGTDYISYTEQAITNSTDFCFEFWIYFTSATAISNGQIRVLGAGVNDPLLFFGTNNTTIGGLTFTTKNVTRLSILYTFPLNTWHHIAISRNTGTVSCFINGILRGTASETTETDSKTYFVGSHPTANWGITGYISDYRSVIGSPVYTSDFTPTTEPLTPLTNTSLLCNFTNAGIYDASTKNVLETVGNAQVDTAVTKFGSGSMYFDGSGDYLIAQSSEDFDFPGDFTIEMWLNLDNVTSTWQAIISRAYAISGGWRLYKLTGSNNLVWYSSSSAIATTSNSPLASGVWGHVAVVRSGSTISIYIDGILRGSGTNSTSYIPGNYDLEIGSGVVTSSFPMTGYIEDLRITKGLARYTSNFTPPGRLDG